MVELPVGVTADAKMTVDIAGQPVELTRDGVVERIGRGEVEASDIFKPGAHGEVSVALRWRSFLRR